MSRIRNLLIVASAIMLFAGIEARAIDVDVDASLSGSSGSVQGFGMASTGYGHLTYFAMQLTGPDGGGGAYTANFTNQNQNFETHSVSSPFLPETDYYLEVVACASDDDGEVCDSAYAQMHTAPGGGTMPSQVLCSESYGPPFPFVNSISPQPFHLEIPGTYTYTIFGGNLEGVIVGFSYQWRFNGAQLGGPGANAWDISSSPNQATITYTVPPYAWSEACFPCGGKIWLQDPATYTPCYVPVTISP